MANEITLTAKLLYAKGGTSVSLGVEGLAITVSGSRFIHHRQQIGTTEEALDLGDLATGGYFVGVNRDTTNFVEIRSGTGATDLVRLNAGEACAFRMSGDASAPFAIANTAAVELEFILIAN